MEPKDPKQIAEQWLDTALKQYGEAEPRVGLEGRVLANLRAEKESLSGGRNWWPALAVAAGIIAFGAAIFFARGHGIAKQEMAVERVAPAMTASSSPHSDRRTAVANTSETQRPRKIGRPMQTARVVEAAAEPRLEQFPAPRPLSEQEEILVHYVTYFPDKAHLMAQAQNKLRELEESEMQQLFLKNRHTPISE